MNMKGYSQGPKADDDASSLGSIGSECSLDMSYVSCHPFLHGTFHGMEDTDNASLLSLILNMRSSRARIHLAHSLNGDLTR